MVALYVGGRKVGTLSDNPEVLARLVESGERVEFRDDAGKRIGTFMPDPVVPWDPSITREELDRRADTPGGTTLAEFWKKMGPA